MRQPDVVIVEGLNVLQAPPAVGAEMQLFASDFFDFTIYVDADERIIEEWYVARFMKLRATVFQDPQAYFHRYASLSDDEARETAHTIWREINGRNLRENILTTRTRAQLVLVKGAGAPRPLGAPAPRLSHATGWRRMEPWPHGDGGRVPTCAVSNTVMQLNL